MRPKDATAPTETALPPKLRFVAWVSVAKRSVSSNARIVWSWSRPLIAWPLSPTRNQGVIAYDSAMRVSAMEPSLCSLTVAGIGCPAMTCVSRVDVRRYGHAMPRPVPGFLAAHAPWWRQARDARVLWANADVSGLSLFVEAQYRGIVAAEGAMRLVQRGA